MKNTNVDFSSLIGCVLSSVSGANKGSERIVFRLNDGRSFEMFHDQDCCESVLVEQVCGDVENLIGEPLTHAQERTSETDPTDIEPIDDKYRDSFTWTYYVFATNKGAVTIRWYGESNGYYSESVSCEWVTP